MRWRWGAPGSGPASSCKPSTTWPTPPAGTAACRKCRAVATTAHHRGLLGLARKAPWLRCALRRGCTVAQGPMGGRGAVLRLGRRRRPQGNGQPISQNTIERLSNAQARWPCLRVRRRRRAGRRLRRRRRQHQRQRRWRRRRGQPRGGGAATAHGAAATRELPVRGRVARRAAALQPLANPCKPARPFPALPRPVQS